MAVSSVLCDCARGTGILHVFSESMAWVNHLGCKELNKQPSAFIEIMTLRDSMRLEEVATRSLSPSAVWTPSGPLFLTARQRRRFWVRCQRLGQEEARRAAAPSG